MIKKDELYEVTVAPTTINHFRKFFPNIKMLEKINVTGEQLPPSSHIKIKYICDFCGKIYERTKYSELRSGEINACNDCRKKKTIQTCQIKYGVDHPMQDFEIHKRSVEGHINNFGKEYNSCSFVNGVPVSKVQKKFCNNLPNFELNYLENGYYYDMFNSKLNLVIEYNGKGHDLQVRRGKISKEKFLEKEQKRIEQISKEHKLLIIEDPNDHLIFQKNFSDALLLVRQAINALKDYDIIQIK